MSDPELEAIRRARLAELQGQAARAGAPSGMPVVPGQEEDDGQRAQQDEMKRQLLTQILDSEARERLSRIALVKPQKADAISNILVQMARSGQVRQRVSETQLIVLLDQVDQTAQPEAAKKITVTRKKAWDDDEDDWDL